MYLCIQTSWYLQYLNKLILWYHRCKDRKVGTPLEEKWREKERMERKKREENYFKRQMVKAEDKNSFTCSSFFSWAFQTRRRYETGKEKERSEWQIVWAKLNKVSASCLSSIKERERERDIHLDGFSSCLLGFVQLFQLGNMRQGEALPHPDSQTFCNRNHYQPTIIITISSTLQSHVQFYYLFYRATEHFRQVNT